MTAKTARDRYNNPINKPDPDHDRLKKIMDPRVDIEKLELVDEPNNPANPTNPDNTTNTINETAKDRYSMFDDGIGGFPTNEIDHKTIKPSDIGLDLESPSVNDCSGGCGRKVAGQIQMCSTCQKSIEEANNSQIQACSTCIITTICPHSSNPTHLCLYELRLSSDSYKSKTGIEDEMRSILGSLRRLQLRIERKMLSCTDEKQFTYFANMLNRLITSYSLQLQTFAKMMGWDKSMMEKKETLMKTDILSKVFGQDNVKIDLKAEAETEGIEGRTSDPTTLPPLIIDGELVEEGGLNSKMARDEQTEHEMKSSKPNRLSTFTGQASNYLKDEIEVEMKARQSDLTVNSDSLELEQLIEESEKDGIKKYELEEKDEMSRPIEEQLEQNKIRADGEVGGVGPDDEQEEIEEEENKIKFANKVTEPGQHESQFAVLGNRPRGRRR